MKSLLINLEESESEPKPAAADGARDAGMALDATHVRRDVVVLIRMAR